MATEHRRSTSRLCSHGRNPPTIPRPRSCPGFGVQRRLLQDPALVEEMTAHNYAVAARHYSYAVLRRHLQALLTDVFGEPA